MLMWLPLELHHLLLFQQLLLNQNQPQNQHLYLVNPLKKATKESTNEEDSTKESNKVSSTTESAPSPSKPSKKTLAPAPVPSKSVWGDVTAGVKELSVDDKMACPDKAPLLGEQPTSKPQSQNSLNQLLTNGFQSMLK